MTWRIAPSLTNERGSHTATLLPNGRVLVAGGNNNSSYLTGAELFDPVQNSWRAVDSMNDARWDHTATLLSNGKVLVVGGNGIGGFLSSAELYDPAADVWTSAQPMARTRGYHAATLLPNGKVLVAGGCSIHNDLVALSSAELFDPMTNTWSEVASMTNARYYHTATLLSDGRVLIAGGYSFPDPNVSKTGGFLSSAEVYDPEANTWSPAPSMNKQRLWHTATLLLDGRVIVVGGGYWSGNNGSELFHQDARPVSDAEKPIPSR
ncbi:MAG: kelch repeat-containing protein [Pseudomonadota bacterium]